MEEVAPEAAGEATEAEAEAGALVAEVACEAYPVGPEAALPEVAAIWVVEMAAALAMASEVAGTLAEVAQAKAEGVELMALGVGGEEHQLA